MLPLSNMEKFARTNLRFNFFAGLADGSLFGVALGFASFSTVLPLFVESLTQSATLIGLVPAVHSAGWLLPQLFLARQITRLRKYKPTALRNTIHERIPFLGLAAVAFFVPTLGLPVSLALAFLLLTWQGLGGGFTANAWTSMISKIIPSESRGTFFGFQAGVANLFLSGAAIIAGYVLDAYDSSTGFAVCFLIASVFFTFSWFALAATREAEDTEKLIEADQPPFWKEAKRILQQDKNFNWFLVVRVLSQFATMGFSFYIIYAKRDFHMDEITSGYFTAALTLTQTVANMGMGWLGDKLGHRTMMVIGAGAAALSALLAWYATSLAWFYPIFILSGIANVSMWTISMTMTVDFSDEKDRPFYIGLAQTLTAPATIIAPLIGGWIADTSGFVPTFGISVGLSIVMMMLLWFVVKNPKKIPHPTLLPKREEI